MERVTASGLTVHERQLRPPADSFDETPNTNPQQPPGTVGPTQATPGDPNGVILVDDGPGPSPWPRSTIRPSAWSGWPAEWATPLWGGRVAQLTDTAWTCVDLNSRVVATMPPYLVGAAASLNTSWLVNPDPDKYNSWAEFAQQLVWDYLLGEVFVLITARYSTGWPARFHVVPPWMVNVEMGGGMRTYTIGGVSIPREDETHPEVPSIVHVPYVARTDEAHGHGPLEAGAGRMVAAQVLSRYATNLVSAGGLPAGTLTHPDELTAEQSQRLQAQWVEARMNSLGLPAVLSGGVTFEAAAYSPEQLALVDLSRWNESRIAVLLGVPPFLMGLPSGGDSMTYSNVEQIFDFHWRGGLSTFVGKLMAALSFRLLPAGTTLEVNRDEYVKADPLTRAQMWQIYAGLGLPWEQIAEAERFTIAAPTPALTSGVLQ